jgi:hypothetical protein
VPSWRSSGRRDDLLPDGVEIAIAAIDYRMGEADEWCHEELKSEEATRPLDRFAIEVGSGAILRHVGRLDIARRDAPRAATVFTAAPRQPLRYQNRGRQAHLRTIPGRQRVAFLLRIY